MSEAELAWMKEKSRAVSDLQLLFLFAESGFSRSDIVHESVSEGARHRSVLALGNLNLVGISVEVVLMFSIELILSPELVG